MIEERYERLKELAEAIVRGENGKAYYEKYLEEIKTVTPQDVIGIVDELYRAEYPAEQLKTGINRFLNLFYEPLRRFPEPRPRPGTFLHRMMLAFPPG